MQVNKKNGERVDNMLKLGSKDFSPFGDLTPLGPKTRSIIAMGTTKSNKKLP